MAFPDSELRAYIGISATTIKNGTTQYLEAFVPEFLPDDKGCYEKIEHFKACIKDPFTKQTSCATINRTRVVSASYWGGSNWSVPCVWKGERVLLYNISGTEQYYWDSMGRDPGLRLRERNRWFIMSQPSSVHDGIYNDVENTNSYFIEFDSNKGQKDVWLHTSIKDGEKHTYDFHIWPEKAIAEFYDDIKNYWRLWSDDHRWKIHNTDDSYIDIHKKNITISCKDTITLTAGKHIHKIAGRTITEKAGMEINNMAGIRYVRRAPMQVVQGLTRKTTMVLSDFLMAGKYTIAVSTTYMLSADTLDYNGKHTFTGDNFTVATASGTVPVIILLGSNSW